MLHDWSWDLESLKKNKEQAPPPEQVPEQEQQPGQPGQEPQPQGELIPGNPNETAGGSQIPADVAQKVLDMLGGGAGQGNAGEGGGQSPFAELGSPVNLLKGGAVPPTPKGVLPTTNPRGMNRGGKVNTNLPLKQTSSIESNLVNRALNIQK